MRTYILKRVIQAIPLLFLISFIVFLSIQATGDPLAAYTVDASLTSDDIARLKAKYGLDQPVPIQYLNWLKNMVTGNWGTSYFTRESVVDMFLERLPNTLILFAVSYGLILVVALILGILTAVRQYSLFDYSVTAYAETLIDIGGGRLRARITRQSVADLRLAPGLPVYALVKSIAFDRETLSVAATTLPGNQARLGETRRD